MSRELKPITLRWPADLIYRLKIAAAIDDTPMQEIARQAVEDRLRKREEPVGAE